MQTKKILIFLFIFSLIGNYNKFFETIESEANSEVVGCVKFRIKSWTKYQITHISTKKFM